MRDERVVASHLLFRRVGIRRPREVAPLGRSDRRVDHARIASLLRSAGWGPPWWTDCPRPLSVRRRVICRPNMLRWRLRTPRHTFPASFLAIGYAAPPWAVFWHYPCCCAAATFQPQGSAAMAA